MEDDLESLPMHPIANIRGASSKLLAGKRIVLGVSGSIAAIKCVELARELTRHGAEVHAVMSKSAQGIITPASLEFGTGNPVITELTGAVEHVALLGDVPERADLLLIAPATANTVGKMAWGIDDTVVTTCATVAFGTGVPVVVAPAMHDAMMRNHPVQQNIETLTTKMGVTWVEPNVEEKKAKLADIGAIVDAVIHRLAVESGSFLAGKRCLVIGGATAEPVDAVRVLTNRSSGRSAVVLARELYRAGAEVDLFLGNSRYPVTPQVHEAVFNTHQELMDLVESTDFTKYSHIWMPAAIGDYSPVMDAGKIASEQEDLAIHLKPLPKVIERVRAAAPDAVLIAFKAEADAEHLIEKAQARMERYGAQFIVANTAASFSADATEVHLVAPDREVAVFTGDKEEVLRDVVAAVSQEAPSPVTVAH